MSKVKHTNGTPLTYRFNQKLFSEIETIHNAIFAKCVTELPPRESISKIRKLTLRASRVKKSVPYETYLSSLCFDELLEMLHQKVTTLEHGKSISRGMALAKARRIAQRKVTIN